ncbi:MAG TPA: glycerol-3-phosphate 1-O-acyltransferase PlsY [Defluviitaleaceae bacterium]|jgi:glycerol-3-phosphate acyltransferase PlsY|nr:glycerol-3-phosphate 1-O-acyltransferase PlsY [Candidatus Epulonipiscium sp.]HOA81046.1 glycerol-3-phosphate 1-O-acyltransferase PlsY [Defluviitaleaceae bacterium]
MFRLVCIVIGYFLGCFQTAYIIGKKVQKIDIRNHGSGNAGTTNVIRVMGWRVGIITFIGDFLKAVVAVLLCKMFFPDNPAAGLYAGLGTVIGHNWPAFLKFKGGKGIAASLGTLLAFDYRMGFICAGIMIVVLLISRFVSLASIIMSVSIPIFLYVFYKSNIEIIILGSLFTLSAIFRHKDNIRRLLKGQETKLGQRTNTKY